MSLHIQCICCGCYIMVLVGVKNCGDQDVSRTAKPDPTVPTCSFCWRVLLLAMQHGLRVFQSLRTVWLQGVEGISVEHKYC